MDHCIVDSLEMHSASSIDLAFDLSASACVEKRVWRR